jgi:hypothetical protein
VVCCVFFLPTYLTGFYRTTSPSLWMFAMTHQLSFVRSRVISSIRYHLLLQARILVGTRNSLTCHCISSTIHSCLIHYYSLGIGVPVSPPPICPYLYPFLVKQHHHPYTHHDYSSTTTSQSSERMDIRCSSFTKSEI